MILLHSLFFAIYIWLNLSFLLMGDFCTRSIMNQYNISCSVMNLLTEIYSQDDMTLVLHEELSVGEGKNIYLNGMVHVESIRERRDVKESPYALSGLAPRLWPFTRHDITSVRFSAIRTLVGFYCFFYNKISLSACCLSLSPLA